jgi:hypothetical protein
MVLGETISNYKYFSKMNLQQILQNDKDLNSIDYMLPIYIRHKIKKPIWNLLRDIIIIRLV